MAAAFAVVVLVTSLPVGAFLTQRHELAATSRQVAELRDENAALNRQAAYLTQPSTVRNLARSDFGFVEPGQKAYEVLPTSGSAPGAAALSGHVPLGGAPVVPGSARSDALLGAGSAGPAPSRATGPPGSGGRAAGNGSGSGESSPGFLGRMLHTLEFWR